MTPAGVGVGKMPLLQFVCLIDASHFFEGNS